MSCGKIKVLAQKFYTMPLAPQVQALWRSPETVALLNYRWEKTAKILEELNSKGQINVYKDILHGREYLDAVQRKDIGHYDTVVMFRIDGTQLYRDKESNCWIYIWVIIDFDPKIHYKL